MAEYYQAGESIEGDRLDGDSRKDLQNKGSRLFHRQLCTRYIAKFNVKARVSVVLTGDAFEKECKADVSEGAAILCDSAIIHTKAKRVSGECVTKGSHRHQTQAWAFAGHSHAQIEHPHDEIIKAIEKRILSIGELKMTKRDALEESKTGS